ncbi:MAG TPA: hypothetical protein VNZ49_02015 [Bacteroidia bacterium]|jgi:hypothetical protein|nr:hypothetical protein [Bacteroidia bacterium]
MENKDKNNVNEPVSFYGKRIVIDSSLSDQENDNYAYWFGLSPEQRLSLATKLTEALYSGTSRSTDKRIYFDS